MTAAAHPEIDQTAACACGAVSVHARGRVLSMLLCTCEDCQRSTGAGHSAVFSMAAGDVAITGETTAFSRPADSGATFTRHFCPRCGTPTFGTSSRAGSIVLIPIGMFGSSSDWFTPNQVIFGRTHRAWDDLAAELPRYDTYRPRPIPLD